MFSPQRPPSRGPFSTFQQKATSWDDERELAPQDSECKKCSMQSAGDVEIIDVLLSSKGNDVASTICAIELEKEKN